MIFPDKFKYTKAKSQGRSWIFPLAGTPLYATFSRRKTEIPIELPLALTDEFSSDEVKSVQWEAFIRKSGLQDSTPDFKEVLSHLRDFLILPMKAAAGSAPFPANWTAGGPWS